MKNLALGLLLVATLGTVYYLGLEDEVQQQVQLNEDMMYHFNEWKTQYNKKYSSEEENTIRFMIFSDNAKFVVDQNTQALSWSVELNEFADLSLLEFQSLYYGYKKQTLNAKPEYLNTNDIPNAVDWRAQGKVNKIKNQGQCGSCWAFSAVSGLESVYAIKTGNLLDLSEQQIVDCSLNGNEGCNGGDLPEAYDYVVQNGIMKTADYPYKARDQKCQYVASKVVFKPTGYALVPPKDNDQLAVAVGKQPVPVCIEAGSRVFQFYSGGVLSSTSCGTNLDHCVEIVGFQDNYWIVRNSWGSSWGESGYVRILKQTGKSAGICGIALEGVYPKY